MRLSLTLVLALVALTIGMGAGIVCLNPSRGGAVAGSPRLRDQRAIHGFTALPSSGRHADPAVSRVAGDSAALGAGSPATLPNVVSSINPPPAAFASNGYEVARRKWIGTAPAGRSSVAGGGKPSTSSPTFFPAAGGGASPLVAQQSEESPSQTGAIVQKVDAAAPGNAFSTSGQRVAVDGVDRATGFRALDVAISEIGEGESVASPARGGTGSDPSGGSSRSRGEFGTGFTYEEELFRSKWGWEAFNEARRAAVQASNSPR